MYYCWYYAEESRDIGQIILTCQFSKARQQGVEAYKVHCMNYTPHPHPDDKKIYNGTVDLLTLVKTLTNNTIYIKTFLSINFCYTSIICSALEYGYVGFHYLECPFRVLKRLNSTPVRG